MSTHYNKSENKEITKRELEVLQYVLQGKTNREIAKTLVVTHHTIKAHVASLLRKMGVRNRVEITLAAIEKGMLPSNHPQDSEQP